MLRRDYIKLINVKNGTMTRIGEKLCLKKKIEFGCVLTLILRQRSKRVWMRAHPCSKAEKVFSSKLAPKLQGPYRIIQKLGLLNYEMIVIENPRLQV